MNRIFQGLLHRMQSSSFSQAPRRFFPHSATVQKTEKIAQRPSENTLGDQARKLIFGSKKYTDFSPKEKRIVDLYQEKLLKVDGSVILPNTKADLERAESEQLLAQLARKQS